MLLEAGDGDGNGDGSCPASICPSGSLAVQADGMDQEFVFGV